MKRVLVAGATGYLGSFVAREFKARGHFVRVLARHPEKLGELGSSVDEVVQAEVTRPETLAEVCDGMEVVFSSVGDTQTGGILQQRGVKTTMKNLEIIHLRLAGESPENLVDVIRMCIGDQGEKMEIRIYRNMKLASDLVVHLIREAEGKDREASDIGIRLAALLKDHGMVAHSLWDECCVLGGQAR